MPGERHHTFLFAIDDDIVIDAAVDGNDARFINHSCDPNCDAVVDDGRIWIETIRDIEPGEELAYDYAYVLEERHTPAREAPLSVPLRRGELSRDDPGEEAMRPVVRVRRVIPSVSEGSAVPTRTADRLASLGMTVRASAARRSRGHTLFSRS